MKKIGLVYFVPLILVITCLFLFCKEINSVFFYKEYNVTIDTSFRYIVHFCNNPFYEDHFLTGNDHTENIFILGSSELTGATEATPYNFISDHFKTKMKGVGHAGNQCFSIYSQLLANEDRLNEAPIVIVLSPGWFYAESANGTASPMFLEYNSPRFLSAILQNDSDLVFKKYEEERISKFYNEVVNPDLGIKLLYLENQSSKNTLQRWFYSTFIGAEKILNKLNLALMKTSYDEVSAYNMQRKPIITESVHINWDSLFAVSKQQQIDKATNNKWGIENDYYNKNIQGKTGLVSTVKEENNQELKDFRMMVKLLKAKKARASFIILPLNPYYYTNVNVLSPIIRNLDTEIAENNFPCLNFWNADSTTFEKGILKDIMHLGNYGWYKADQFIVNTYHLSK